MKVKLSVLFGFTALLLLLSSCSSLPLPGTPTESLFILCGDLERDLGIDQNGGGHTLESLRVTIINLETLKEKDLVFYPAKTFISTTLEPGKYAMNNRVAVTVRYKGSSHTSTRDESIHPAPFLIEENTVFVSPIILKVADRGGWYSFSSYFSSSTSNSLKKKSMEDVLNERRFKAWELYQLIGWEIQEE